jgi:hypothetical protein
MKSTNTRRSINANVSASWTTGAERRSTTLHKNATTTHAMRAEIRVATGSDSALARQFSVSRDTIRKWRESDHVEDKRTAAHRLQTTLNPNQEELVIYLRTMLMLPLDDLLAVVREFIEPRMSRSALDRLLRRRGQSPLSAVTKLPGAKPVKYLEPGHIRIDRQCAPRRSGERGPNHVFVAVDQATRWLYIAIRRHATPTTLKSFLHAVNVASPFRIRTLLTPDSRTFDVSNNGSQAPVPTAESAWLDLCRALGVGRELNKANGLKAAGVERHFGGQPGPLLRSQHTSDTADWRRALKRQIWIYNHLLPQKTMKHLAPIQALHRWAQTDPDLFKRTVRTHCGSNGYGLMLAKLGAFSFISTSRAGRRKGLVLNNTCAKPHT